MQKKSHRTEKPAFSGLEETIRYRFHNQDLLTEAMTHSSWTNEHGSPHNERLEFLGDAVLELLVSTELYERFPTAREGAMTAMRASLVGEKSLADIARELGIGAFILMNKGEENQGGRERNALIADALEALIGAVYLDGGPLAAKCLVQHLFSQRWPRSADPSRKKDFKTMLQEATQSLLHSLPVYRLSQAAGPEHAREFKVEVVLSDGRTFTAAGSSLKIAEQNAAKAALSELAGSE